MLHLFHLGYKMKADFAFKNTINRIKVGKTCGVKATLLGHWIKAARADVFKAKSDSGLKLPEQLAQHAG